MERSVSVWKKRLVCALGGGGLVLPLITSSGTLFVEFEHVSLCSDRHVQLA